MKDYYVILTGGINNAGDYLIAWRARQLLERWRADRDIVEVNAREALEGERLEVVNRSRCLILCGGPALSAGMYGGIYRLCEPLDRISVPILSMGIGWNSAEGEWAVTHAYPLSPKTQSLLRRMDTSGRFSSVRDYHTANVLAGRGYRRILMTGCPAYYDLDHIGAVPALPEGVRRVSFSLGRKYVRSSAMESSMRSLLSAVRRAWPDAELSVVFHHSTDSDVLRKTYPAQKTWAAKQEALLAWLGQEGFRVVDISGGAANLVQHYQDCDLHIGYRVHAHIFMCSISKPSILIAEDGRAHGVHEVLGGYLFEGFYRRDNFRTLDWISRRVGIGDAYRANLGLENDLTFWMRYEVENGLPRTRAVRSAIDAHSLVMRRFADQLP